MIAGHSAWPQVRRGCALAICAFPGGDLAAGEECMGSYAVSVGEAAVTRHAANDFWSRPDLMVRVQRQDPVILDQVEDLGSP